MHGRRLAVVAALVLAVAILTSVCATAQTKTSLDNSLAKLKAAPDNTVVATVYGQNITKSELATALWGWVAPQTLDEYINYKVVMLAMKKRGISVTQADLDKKIADAKKTLPPGETLDTMLAKMKYPMGHFKAAMTMQAGLEKIVATENAPGADDYAQYIKARHILVSVQRPAADAKPEDTAKAEADAKAKADKILAEIKGGKSFDAAAKEYSDDPGSKEKGGDLGWFAKGRMVPEFSDAAFALKAGEISQPVKSPFGYHIIQVTKVGKDATGADKTELKNMILETKLQMLMRPTFDKLKQEAKVVNKVAPDAPTTSPVTTPATPRPGTPKPGAGKPAPKPTNTTPPVPK